jgi:hypothetical protein
MIFFSFKRRGPKRIEPWRGCWAWAQNLGGISRPVVAVGLGWRSGLLLATPRCTGIALPGAPAIDFFRYRPFGHRPAIGSPTCHRPQTTGHGQRLVTRSHPPPPSTSHRPSGTPRPLHHRMGYTSSFHRAVLLCICHVVTIAAPIGVVQLHSAYAFSL